MKSITQQKADLLDDFIRKFHSRQFPELVLIHQLIEGYKIIKAPYSLTDNPFINEIFNRRMLNHIDDWKRTHGCDIPENEMRVSHLPRMKHHLVFWNTKRNFGLKCIESYLKVFEKYPLAGSEYKS